MIPETFGAHWPAVMFYREMQKDLDELVKAIPLDGQQYLRDAWLKCCIALAMPAGNA